VRDVTAALQARAAPSPGKKSRGFLDGRLGEAEALLGRLPKREQAEFGRLLRGARAAATLQDSHAEALEAHRVLEQHRADYEALLQDEARFLDLASRVFAEPAFADLHFDAEAVGHAFEAVGYPAPGAADESSLATVRKAALFLADEAYRMAASARLLLQVVELVKAGRYLEGSLTEHEACLLSERPEEAITFIMAMFLPGYAAWEAQQEQEQLRMLKEFGLTPASIQRMGADGLQRWMDENLRDPDKLAELERRMAMTPALRASLNTACRASEDAAIELLDREDAEELLLGLDELMPWLNLLGKRFVESPAKLEDTLRAGRADEATARAFGELIWDLVDEMAPAVFTPERRKQLHSQLLQFHHRLAEDGDAAADAALKAVTFIDAHDDPADSAFLRALCYKSVVAVMKGGADPDEVADEETAG
jgi:hypothetical protein